MNFNHYDITAKALYMKRHHVLEIQAHVVLIACRPSLKELLDQVQAHLSPKLQMVWGVIEHVTL